MEIERSTKFQVAVIGNRRRSVAAFCRQISDGSFAISEKPPLELPIYVYGQLPNLVIYATDVRKSIPDDDLRLLKRQSDYYPIIVVGDLAYRINVHSYKNWMISAFADKYPIYIINTMVGSDFDDLIRCIKSRDHLQVAAILTAKWGPQMKHCFKLDWEAVTKSAVQILSASDLVEFGRKLLMLRTSQIGQSCLIPRAELVKTRPLKNAVRAIMLMPRRCRVVLLDNQYEYELLCINADDLTVMQFLRLMGNSVIYKNNDEEVSWGRENYTDFMTAGEIIEAGSYPSNAIYMLAKSRYGFLVQMAFTQPGDIGSADVAMISSIIGRQIGIGDISGITRDYVMFTPWWVGSATPRLAVVKCVPRWNLARQLLYLLGNR